MILSKKKQNLNEFFVIMFEQNQNIYMKIVNKNFRKKSEEEIEWKN